MSRTPPKKKLCQLSIKDMLKPRLPSPDCEDNKKSTDPTSVVGGSKKSSEFETNVNRPDTADSLTARADSNIHKQTMKSCHREEKNTARPSTHSRDPKTDEGGRGSEKSADLRDVMAKAAEQRMRVKKPATDSGGKEREWRGTSLQSLPCLSAANPNMPPVVPSPTHTILVKLPLSHGAPPLPYPSHTIDLWDQLHVRMPCSPKSQYPSSKDSVVPRWSVICEALSQKMECVEDLEQAVLAYNVRYASKWKFRGLYRLLQEEFEEEERVYFFGKILPAMVQLALSLPQLVTQPPPLLTQGSSHSLTLSQMQIASLLANAFFCTFPRRNAKGNETEYARYPDINFNRLFCHKEQTSLEKIKCLLHYFRTVTSKPPTGLVTFTRQTVTQQDAIDWVTSKRSLPRFHVSSTGLIEDTRGLLQVDFANRYLGGGVLGLGCVQEEIRFVLCPELIVSRLFTQALEKTDALIITGCEQYNIGSGYSSTFRWEGPFEDKTPVDQWGRRMCQVTAIDALHFTKQPNIQYKPSYIARELNKAYAGFKVIEGSPGTPTGVATGNWGCGAFRGNPRLKALIQLAVCGHIGRDIAYFTFGDEKLRDDLYLMYVFLKENNVTVGELTQVLNHHGCREWSDGTDLFQYICHSLGSYDSDTDQEASRESTDARDEAKTGGSESEEGAARASASSHTNKRVSAGLEHSRMGSKAPLSEEQILEVLSECDRLFESEEARKKQLAEVSGSKTSSSSDHPNRADQHKSGAGRPEKVSQSTSRDTSIFTLLEQMEHKAVNK